MEPPLSCYFVNFIYLYLGNYKYFMKVPGVLVPIRLRCIYLGIYIHTTLYRLQKYKL